MVTKKDFERIADIIKSNSKGKSNGSILVKKHFVQDPSGQKKKYQYPKGWKFPGGYYKDDVFVHYKGINDPKFIESQKEYIESSPNGWWVYVNVPDKLRPERFKSKFDRFKNNE
jgi:hypothetical protein